MSDSEEYRRYEYFLDPLRWLAAGLGIGVLVGGALGLLFAPKSGRETREQIKTLATDVTTKAREYAGQAAERAATTYGAVSERAKTVAAEAAAKAREVATEVSTTVATVKEGATRAVEAVKEGVRKAAGGGETVAEEDKSGTA